MICETLPPVGLKDLASDFFDINVKYAHRFSLQKHWFPGLVDNLYPMFVDLDTTICMLQNLLT
jgi:hypothetical protein